MNVFINPKPPKFNKFEKIVWTVVLWLLMFLGVLCVLALIGGILFGLLPSLVGLAKGY